MRNLSLIMLAIIVWSPAFASDIQEIAVSGDVYIDSANQTFNYGAAIVNYVSNGSEGLKRESRYPGAYSDPSAGWTGEADADGWPDNACASVNTTTQPPLILYTFGFTGMKDGDIIDSIIIDTTDVYGTSGIPTTKRDTEWQLTKTGDATGVGTLHSPFTFGSGNNCAGSAHVGTLYPTGAPLWGTTWTAAEIRADGFGVIIKDDNTTAHELGVDAIRITVVYHTPTRRSMYFFDDDDITLNIPSTSPLLNCSARVFCSAVGNDGDVSAYLMWKPFMEGDNNGTARDSAEGSWLSWYYRVGVDSNYNYGGCDSAADGATFARVDGYKADRMATALGTATVSATGWVSFPIDTTYVRAVMTNSATYELYDGLYIILIGNASGTPNITFDSREASDTLDPPHTPVLVVVYGDQIERSVTPSVLVTFSLANGNLEDCYTLNAANINTGGDQYVRVAGSSNANNRRFGFFRPYNIATALGYNMTVTACTLLAYIEAATGTANTTAHRVLKPAIIDTGSGLTMSSYGDTDSATASKGEKTFAAWCWIDGLTSGDTNWVSNGGGGDAASGTNGDVDNRIDGGTVARDRSSTAYQSGTVTIASGNVGTIKGIPILPSVVQGWYNRTMLENGLFIRTATTTANFVTSSNEHATSSRRPEFHVWVKKNITLRHNQLVAYNRHNQTANGFR